MKILHVLSDSNIGGAGMLLLGALRHFDRDKFEISVVLPKNAELVPRVLTLGYKVIEIENGRDASYDKKATKELMQIFKSEKPDIVHTHSSLSARIAARRCRVPLVFQTHHCAVVPPKYKTVFPMKTVLGLINNHYSDAVIATAPVARDILVSMGTKKEKINVIINGAEPLRALTDKEKCEKRRALGLSEENFVFSIVARLEAVKDHRTFILAASETAKVHSNARFLIIGGGSLEASLKSFAADCGVEDKIIFTGFAPDVAEYMNITDVNVNSSFSETSCLAISEGMSLGVPAIVSDCAGNTSLVKEGENALVFATEDSEMLATAMITLIENRELLEKLGRGAREAFDAELCASVMTKKMEELYISEYEKKTAGR